MLSGNAMNAENPPPGGENPNPDNVQNDDGDAGPSGVNNPAPAVNGAGNGIARGGGFGPARGRPMQRR